MSNGARGLTLVFAGSVSANGYGLDATPETLARVLDGVVLDAGIAIDFNLSPPTRDAVRHFAALAKSRKLAPSSIDMRASINPIGGFAASGASPRPWSSLAQRFAAMVRELADQGFRGPFAVADGRIIHMPAARKRRNWPSRSRARSNICARSRRAASRSMRRAA